MVNFREASVEEDASLALLAEYFSSRAQSFPSSMGEYRTVFPDPENFTAPDGVFLVVEDEDLAGDPADVGCGGVRKLAPDAESPVRFEVKHLWVQPHVRGRGIGRALLAELERRAREFGAEQLVLDTNESLTAAGGLYLTSGFVPIAPYNDNPNATHWYGKELEPLR